MSATRATVSSSGGTVTCAVSAGTRAAVDASLVPKALRLGRQLTKLNRAVPLPVLLDAAALAAGAFRAATRTLNETDEQYQKWLRGLRRAMCGLLDHHDFLSRVRGHDDLSGFLPLLSRAWPASSNDEAQAHDRMYERLLQTPDNVHAAWLGPRTGDPKFWRWWPNPAPKAAELRLSLLHALYFPREEQRLGQYVHHFNHGAGEFFLESRHARLLDDQMRRILKLRQRKPRSQSWPHTQSYEELDPRFGAPSLSALVGDTIEQVWYNLLINPRINSPPPYRPPQTVQVHLGWMVAEDSPEAEIEIHPEWKWFEKPAQGVAPVQRNSFRHASLLQGLAALVVDDWRHFLDPLPVDFFLHRESPRYAANGTADPNRICAGTTGSRWKEMLNGEADCLPPAAAVTLLFDKIERGDVILATDGNTPAAPLPIGRRGEDSTNPADSWWCLFVCREDMPGLGFKYLGGDRWRCRTGVGGWRSGDHPYTHVVVLDPASHQRTEGQGALPTRPREPDGVLCRLAAGPVGAELLPLSRRALSLDFAFSTLRIQLVDVLIEQLQRLM